MFVWICVSESNTLTIRASLGSPFVMDTFRAISWPRIHGPSVVSFAMRSGSLWKLVETKSTLLIYQMLLNQLLIHKSEQQKLRALTDMFGSQQKFTTNTWMDDNADTETTANLSQTTTGNIQTGSLKLDTNADVVSYCNHSAQFD